MLARRIEWCWYGRIHNQKWVLKPLLWSPPLRVRFLLTIARLNSDMRVNTNVGGSFSRAIEEVDPKTPLLPKNTTLLFKEKGKPGWLPVDMQIQSPISKVIVEENNSEQTPKVRGKRLSIKQKEEETKEENQAVSVSDSSALEAEVLPATKVEITKTRTVVSSQKTHDHESKDSNIGTFDQWMSDDLFYSSSSAKVAIWFARAEI